MISLNDFKNSIDSLLGAYDLIQLTGHQIKLGSKYLKDKNVTARNMIRLIK